MGTHGPPHTINLSVARISVTTLGRALSVAKIAIEWVDPAQTPRGWGSGPLTPDDYAPGAPMPDVVAYPPGMHLEDGERRVFLIKVYATVPGLADYTAEIRAKVTMSNDRSYTTNAVGINVKSIG